MKSSTYLYFIFLQKRKKMIYSRILKLTLLFLFVTLIVPMSYAGRCGCKQGCDMEGTIYTPGPLHCDVNCHEGDYGEMECSCVSGSKKEEGLMDCGQACAFYGGWNGSWTDTDTKKQFCETPSSKTNKPVTTKEFF